MYYFKKFFEGDFVQENNEVFQRLLYVDSEFIKAHNKWCSLTIPNNISSVEELNKYKQELDETSLAMSDFGDRGFELYKQYRKSINDSSDIFLIPKDLPKLSREHIVGIIDALIDNHNKYIQKNSNALPENIISLWQEKISNLKSARKYIQDKIDESYKKMADDVDYKGDLYTDEDEIALINILNNTSSNVSDKLQSNNSNNNSSGYKYCTKCGTKLNSDAMFCGNCGNKISDVNESDNKLLEINNKSSVSNSNVHFHDESFHIHSNSGSDFCCPNCGSENVQSLPIIYQSGSSGTSAVTGATNFIAVTKGNTMTDLARSVAPPQPKEVNDTWATISLGAAVICMFIGLIPIAIICFVLAVILFIPVNNAKEYNEKQFPIEYDNWRNSYLCHRCGTVFRR